MASDKLLKAGTSAAPEQTTSDPVCTTLTVADTSAGGIKVDTATPIYGYQLLPSPGLFPGSTGVPPVSTFRDTIHLREFPNGSSHELHTSLQIPADYAPGTPLTFWWAWAQNTVDTGGAGGSPGAAKWQVAFAYAKGYDQAAFPAETVASAVQTASGTAYQQLTASAVIANGSPGAGQISSAALEPGGSLICRVFRDPADAADTLDQSPFLIGVGLVYQSRVVGVGTSTPPWF